MKSLFFEKAFDVNATQINTTMGVNRVIEERRGKKIRVVEVKSSIITKRGSIFDIIPYDIEKLVDEAIKD